MKCLSCDVILTPFEATRKYHGTSKYVDLCNHCFSTIKSDLMVVERPDLQKTYEEAYEDDYVFMEYEK